MTHQVCVQVGAGLYSGVFGQGITGLGEIPVEGSNNTFGVFAIGSLSAGGFGTMDVNGRNFILGGGGAFGAGGAAGVQFCSVSLFNCF